MVGLGAVAGCRLQGAERIICVDLSEGRLELVDTPEDAVEGADFVQENAPEREELKRALLARAGRAAGDGVILCSSTSGLRPSRLQLDMPHPELMAVGHPFNPVYLLPLVEVCAGELTAPETTARAQAIYASVGMRPLVVRTEIDGFIADRLMEALWREALWLVADDVATVAEIDDALRLGDQGPDAALVSVASNSVRRPAPTSF
jgi:carnitine 3-dehydrogenase